MTVRERVTVMLRERKMEWEMERVTEMERVIVRVIAERREWSERWRG